MTSPRVPIRVVKLGGSLLDLEELPERLTRWIAAQRAMASVMVVGGGWLADALRAAVGSRGRTGASPPAGFAAGEPV
jgi:hypothetical protein